MKEIMAELLTNTLVPCVTIETLFNAERQPYDKPMVTNLTGEIVFALSDEDIQSYEDSEEDLVDSLPLPKIDGILWVHWFHDLANDTLTLTAGEVEPDPDWTP
jgi:hypothetical protein